MNTINFPLPLCVGITVPLKSIGLVIETFRVGIDTTSDHVASKHPERESAPTTKNRFPFTNNL